MMLNKTEILFIRACKSKQPSKRVLSVYKRFYLFNNNNESQKHIVLILAKICDKICPFSNVSLIEELSSDYRWKYGKELNFSTVCLNTLISKIRFTQVNMLPKEIIWPKQFKLSQGE